MRPVVLLAAGSLALTGLLAPASASSPNASQVYFHCPSSAKAINASPLTDGGITGWDTTRPTTSFTAGGGCGFAETGTLSGAGMQTLYDFPGAGTVAGDLDKLTFQFHVIGLAPSRVTSTATLSLRLTIDGQSMFGLTPTGESAAKSVPVTLTPSSTGASSLAEVTVTGLNFVDAEDAEEISEHSVAFAVSATSDAVTAFVLDATEVDSGITFNPTANKGAVVQATTPGPLPVFEE